MEVRKKGLVTGWRWNEASVDFLKEKDNQELVTY